MPSKVGKDLEATVSYWRDSEGASVPNPEHDAEILLGDWDQETRTKLVRDIRGTESDFTLDVHGFQTYTLAPKDRDSKIEGEQHEEYFEEIGDMLKKMTGAKEVIVFGNVTRKLARGAMEPRAFKGAKIQAPSPRVHADFAPQTAEALVQGSQLIPGGQDLAAKCSRWMLLGIWRPTKHVQRDPLVLADARTVPDSDFVDLVRDKTWGKDSKMVMSTVKHGDSEHEWYYWSDMTPRDVLLFKHYDTRKDGQAWRCAHTSMNIPGTENLPPRESFEVRALVGF